MARKRHRTTNIVPPEAAGVKHQLIIKAQVEEEM